jgi:capsular exopolysaccharide synthesis family protein
MSENYNQFADPENDGINLKAILGVARIHWYLFIITMALGFAGAWLINRYTTPVYMVQSQILLTNEEKGRSGMEILGEQSIGGSFNPFDPTFINDKIQIIKSKQFISDIVDTLNFTERYFEEGEINTTERYRTNPFKAQLVVKNPSIYGVNFKIVFKSPQVFELFAANQENTIIKNTYRTGSWIYHPSFNLKIDLLLKPEFFNEIKDVKFQYMLLEKINVASYYSSALIIEPVKSTKSLQLTIQDNTPEKAVDFLNEIANSFVRKGLDDKNIYFVTSLQFINSELKKVEQSLDSLELGLEALKKQKKIVDIPAKASTVIGELTSIEGEKYEQELLLKSASALRTYILEHVDLTNLAPATFGITEPLLIPYINKVAETNIVFNRVSRIYLPGTKNYNEALENYRNAKEQLLESVKNVEMVIGLQVDEYSKKVGQLESEISNIPAAQRQFIGWERKLGVQENIYLLLLEKKFEYEIAQSGNKSDFSVLNEAEIIEQTQPDTRRNYIIAFILALFIPSLILFLRIYFDRKLRSREQIEKGTKIPFLAAIPHHKGEAQLVFLQNSKSITAEAFRNLRSAMNYMLPEDNRSKVVLITSTVGGEGKTFCTLNLAHVLAISGKTVVILGLDLRKPRLHLSFDIKNESGMSNYLVGRAKLDDVIKTTGIDNLAIIPSGPVPPNPSELILSQPLKNAITELKKRYDYILLDTAPLGLVTDAIDLMALSDLTLYMMRENYSEVSSVGFLNSLFVDKKLLRVGIVLNDSTFSGAKYGYGYGGYSYGYSYGYGYGYNYGYGYGYYDDHEQEKPWHNFITGRYRKKFD